MTAITEHEAVLASLAAAERLAAIRALVAGRIVFTTSFGIEDQAITHMIATQRLAIDIVTLDTGRLFEETQALWAETESRYGISIRGYYPDSDAVSSLAATNGTNGFYRSIEARKACCHVRKVEPLRRALSGASAWITGLRADQSANRSAARIAESNAEFGLLKFNPLIDWTRDTVVDFVRTHAVPVNPLHARGFPSIGCAPCTRAIHPHEDERAGRWWWESEDRKECGLHITADGRVARATEAAGP